MCSNNWDSFWNALNAIGTLSAVLVSLHLASRKKKAELSLHKHRTYHKDGKIDLIITIKNVGDAPITKLFWICYRKQNFNGKINDI
jgi:hypothetical protein